MFISQAHSFRQQAKLAVTLAWVAGYTNIITLFVCGTVTSHVSGITSYFGKDIFSGAWSAAAYGGFLLFSFCSGAAVSGFCTELGRRRGWESIFVLPIIVETSLLAAFAVMVELMGIPKPWTVPLFVMTGLAAAAMGLQNATITLISNGQVRTTHVTGVLTDIGQELVQFLWWLADRQRDVPPGDARIFAHATLHHPKSRHLVLLVFIFTVFALGAGLGTLVYEAVPRVAMFPPVAFLMWIIYQDISTPIAEIEPATLAISGLDLPASLAVFHMRKDHDRHGRVHRIPNLLAWAERLPASHRVIILDLLEITQLNANANLEFHTLLNRLTARGKFLILSGLTPQQWTQMAGDANTLLPVESVCPDMELAIARGLNLLAQVVAGTRADG